MSQFGLSWSQATAQQPPGELVTPLGIHLALLAALLGVVGRIRRLLPLLLPAALFAPAETFYLLWFGQPSDAHLYGVIADTNFEEVTSWLGPWLLPVIVATCLWVAALAWMARSWWHADWRWRHRSRTWVLTAGALLTGLLLVLHQAVSPAIAKLVEGGDDSYLEHSVSKPRVGVIGVAEAIYPWGVPLRWANYREHQQALARHAQVSTNFDFGVRWRAGTPPARQIQILVIGETGRPDRWGLFGATRDTTPRLASRSGLIPFSDAVSAASATREAVPLMLTRRPPQDLLAPPSDPSLVAAFRQAGYRTYWLSTQGAAGRHETPVSVLAGEADERHFINAVDYRQAGALDGELLPLLQKILDRNEPRQLIVLHTLGSHLSYAHRYPRDFERFQPALQPGDVPDIWSSAVLDKLINAYDNSVLYTDHMLDEVITKLDRSGAAATLLYAADHGETLYDGSCRRGGHGFDAETNYRIPMVIWTSAAWQAARPQAQAALQAHARSPVSSLSIFATMTGLAGFDTARPNGHADLGSEQWRPSRRLITHFGDFDADLKGKSCSSH
ncbi:MAG TPA: phosphoethanolamine transferase [Roseateles sp.]|uniref:phosphoethanolamine transferase n=1 Tax=Roseateles sp. TaxID=1971397 RepID=UPI002ED9FCEE